ncbi:hypothetical protein L228DRAFT_261852 [Xylona heveae TC161]|uniref:Mediator of RNA polymerase II transcription subunit 20 n=1 Tax=Xylona heveae (strain CBS 132557 / TC161) TaxID=1328760 RepID=A0A165G425_XYLHT|nr:hypothetical protein L228DRAFT_261852 [Xylona heveae TC161]KZF21713.1 hypothetical protein L228DRAFT_261852 [Xylona heveae TC161]
MSITGLFFIPSSPQAATYQQVVDRLTRSYDDVELVGRWALEHRLMRETAPSLPAVNGKAPPFRYLHFLNLSHQPGRSFVGVSGPSARKQQPQQQAVGPDAMGGVVPQEPAVILVPAPATILTLPQGQSGDLIQLVASKLGPLWTNRHTLHVQPGVAYATSDFVVRVGEVKQGVTGPPRGVLVEITYQADDTSGSSEQKVDPSEWAAGQAIIKAFWQNLNIQGSRDYAATTPGVGAGLGWDLERQYFELLKLRG